MTSTLPKITQKIAANSQLVLQISSKNSSSGDLLFRPTIEDWVIDNNEIISSTSTINPPYTSLEPQEESNQIITLQLPSNLSPGQTLKNWLRFPGVQEEAIPINLEIIPHSNLQTSSQILTISLSISLPCFSVAPDDAEGFPNPTNESILALIPGMIDLDTIPSRWLVAELCVKLYQIGEKYSESDPGFELFYNLESSIFHQNGVTAFSLAKVPDWIAKTITEINSTLGCEAGEGHLLSIWERWLFNLVETDLDASKTNNNYPIPKFFAEDIVTQIGMSSEQWFSGIVLGLASLSVPLENTLKKIITPENNQSTTNGNYENHQATINLMTRLPDLDLIPVRWLVVEILLKIAQIGDQYSQTKTGNNLLSRLKRTYFFNNGIIAFTSAQVPRWLDISQSAITAYYSSIGFPSGNNGLLNLWEMWLWSLAPNHLYSSDITNKFAASTPTTELFVKELGMDYQRWFAAIILGLGKISPRIAQQLTDLINQEGNFPSESLVSNSDYHDVIAEQNSLQR